VELEQALLPEQLVLAVAELLLELKPVLQSCNPCFRSRWFRTQCIRSLSAAATAASVNNFVTTSSQSLCLLHGEPIGRSQPVSMSEQIQRMGCSSSGYDEPGHRFRQQLRGELVRPCRSDRRRKRS
jgi:hypothetical protein